MKRTVKNIMITSLISSLMINCNYSGAMKKKDREKYDTSIFNNENENLFHIGENVGERSTKKNNKTEYLFQLKYKNNIQRNYIVEIDKGNKKCKIEKFYCIVGFDKQNKKCKTEKVGYIVGFDKQTEKFDYDYIVEFDKQNRELKFKKIEKIDKQNKKFKIEEFDYTGRDSTQSQMEKILNSRFEKLEGEEKNELEGFVFSTYPELISVPKNEYNDIICSMLVGNIYECELTIRRLLPGEPSGKNNTFNFSSISMDDKNSDESHQSIDSDAFGNSLSSISGVTSTSYNEDLDDEGLDDGYVDEDGEYVDEDVDEDDEGLHYEDDESLHDEDTKCSDETV